MKESEVGWKYTQERYEGSGQRREDGECVRMGGEIRKCGDTRKHGGEE